MRPEGSLRRRSLVFFSRRRPEQRHPPSLSPLRSAGAGDLNEGQRLEAYRRQFDVSIAGANLTVTVRQHGPSPPLHSRWSWRVVRAEPRSPAALGSVFEASLPADRNRILSDSPLATSLCRQVYPMLEYINAHRTSRAVSLTVGKRMRGASPQPPALHHTCPAVRSFS